VIGYLLYFPLMDEDIPGTVVVRGGNVFDQGLPDENRHKK
jgi:hypothetical protein